MPLDSEMRSRRDSWPPTQVRLEASDSKRNHEPRPLREDIDDDPFTYFLTPAPVQEDDEAEDDSMDFDAGIEDPSQPQEIVRSVSPSSLCLDGLRKPDKDRPSSPEFDSDMTSPDEDDDEDYIRFPPNGSTPMSIRDINVDGARHQSRSPIFGRSANALLSPTSFPAPQPRGQSHAAGRGGRPRSLSIRSRPSRLWREPSPDVWSIEEETEEELTSEMENSAALGGDGSGVENDKGVEKKAAKPKKRVRFVLPAQ